MNQLKTCGRARGSQVFDETYYLKGCGPDPYARSAQWLNFYQGLVEQLIRSLSPRSVLDAGCALGMVVEAFWDRGVEAKGIDISEFAIANVRPDMAEHCTVGSLAEPITGRFDLVTCIEVLEHMPAVAAAAAVGHISAVTDTILFTSSPYDFDEMTHVNVRPPISWIRQFGEHGLWPDMVYDASFVVPHAMLLRRGEQPSDAALVAYIERLRLQHLLTESTRNLGAALQKFDAAQRSFEETTKQQQRKFDAFQLSSEETTKQQQANLAAMVEAESTKVSQLQVQCRLIGEELHAAQAAAARLAAIETSTTWRATASLRNTFGRLPAPVRRLAYRSVKLGWWALTPHRIPARLRNLRASGANPAFAIPARVDSEPVAVARATTAGHTTTDLLEAALDHLKQLPTYAITRGLRPRVTMVTDSIAADSFFGGVGTATILASQWANRRGASLRIATLRAEPVRDNVANLLGTLGVTAPNDVEFRYADIIGAGKPLDVSSEDVFLTTSWWSTANTLGAIPAERIVYILQEDERMFYPAGDEQLRAQEVMQTPGLRRVINSRLLYGHLMQSGIGGLDTHGTWFEPAFPESVYYPDRSHREKMNLFFYARPNNARNLYLRGLQALGQAVARGVLKPDEWNVHFVGHGLQPLTLPGGMEVNLWQGLTWERYVGLMRSMDLGLSLMMTPHPSYPPLDLAACGSVAVTNIYGPKTSLADYSQNIICMAPDPEALLQGLAHGVALSRDTERRQANHAQAGLSRSWDASFAPVLDWLEKA